MPTTILGELEQKIMNILWESETPLKPADVQERLKNRYAYTTVMTLLSRLHKKGLLQRSKKGKAYYYSAAKSKEEFAKPKLARLFSNLYNNFGDVMLAQFIDSIKEDPDTLIKIEKYMKYAKKKRKV